ncbi:molybdenum cofactor guanylyltransferase MobA [Pontibacter sp. JAM-7]|uniref:molybdenum cofactor guanylyltransferase MobA n=1 Tax=Pontibacter sp. JAM-7 TaxID=3366581 RepID=UPI003AF4ACBD
MSDNTHLPVIPAVILSGGLSRRMGGVDKAWLPLKGQPLISHVLQRIEPQVRRCLINVNRNPESYQSLGWPVISDLNDQYEGPLQGFVSGLMHTEEPWVLFAPCDMPQLPTDLLSRLWQASGREQCSVVVAHDGERLQPVVVLLRRDVLASLQQALHNGERKVGRWVMDQHPAVVDFSDQADAFINLNRPEELAALEG